MKLQLKFNGVGDDGTEIPIINHTLEFSSYAKFALAQRIVQKALNGAADDLLFSALVESAQK